MRIASVTTVLAAFALGACATQTAIPFGAMFSADEALKVVFDDICAPAILEGKSVEALARAQSMVEVDASGIGAKKGDREWRLATIGYTSVTAWSDGTCMISVEFGDAAKHSAYLLSSMAARGVMLTKGATRPASSGGANTAYCTADPQPLVLGIITPTAGSTRKNAVVANLFKAKGIRPDFCKPA
jgi:hypothetical protein